MNALPRITVVTPSFNQARYLERTILSVLNQGYPDLEYFVFDGGSTDGSIEIINSYQHALSHSVSEPDSGQSAAINKGLRIATGEIICWLNSDDCFCPGTLDSVGRFFAANQEAQAMAGHVQVVDANGTEQYVLDSRYSGLTDLARFWKGYHLHQSSIFWRKKLMDRVGILDESLHLTMDYELWLRFAEVTEFHILNQVLSIATRHQDAKTGLSYVPYKHAQLQTLWKRYGSPFSLNHWTIRLRLYQHRIRLAFGSNHADMRVYRD